ncbi:MAG: hypothetical protein EGP82_10220 [Odoribacter splanchnicus]|nr:hypothetical protein [Odoribacter splanchnicus]
MEQIRLPDKGIIPKSGMPFPIIFSHFSPQIIQTLPKNQEISGQLTFFILKNETNVVIRR